MRTITPVLASCVLTVAAVCAWDTVADDAAAVTAARGVITTSAAPAAIGPYSQAVQAGGTVYLSGQIGIDPKTGEMVEGGVAPETRQVMANARAVLAAAGLTMADVVQCIVFLADMDDYGTVNEIYSEFFPEGAPARAAVQVARLPKDARIEIMMTAVGGAN